MVEWTGYEDYDKVLLTEIGAWRYRPNTVNATSDPLCSQVEFTCSLE